MMTWENDLCEDDWRLCEDDQVLYIVRPFAGTFEVFRMNAGNEEAIGRAKILRDAQKIAHRDLEERTSE
jgi:hypothetical protein